MVTKVNKKLPTAMTMQRPPITCQEDFQPYPVNGVGPPPGRIALLRLCKRKEPHESRGTARSV